MEQEIRNILSDEDLTVKKNKKIKNKSEKKRREKREKRERERDKGGE